MYKDPKKQAEYYARYRETHKEHKRNYDATKGSPHKRIYTENGGVWKCAICNVSREDGAELHIHHKDQNNKNNNFDNLVCLCRGCHETVHNNWAKSTRKLIKLGIIDWTGIICQKTTEIDD